MCKNKDKTGLKGSRLYYRVLVMFMETLGKVTHLVSSQNGQKCTKIPKKRHRNDVESGPKNSRLYYSVLMMFTETLAKVTHLVSSQNGQKCTKIHKECTTMRPKLV